MIRIDHIFCRLTEDVYAAVYQENISWDEVQGCQETL